MSYHETVKMVISMTLKAGTFCPFYIYILYIHQKLLNEHYPSLSLNLPPI